MGVMLHKFVNLSCKNVTIEYFQILSPEHFFIIFFAITYSAAYLSPTKSWSDTNNTHRNIILTLSTFFVISTVLLLNVMFNAPKSQAIPLSVINCNWIKSMSDLQHCNQFTPLCE